MIELPYHVRRRHRNVMRFLVLVATLLFLLDLFFLWIAAGMMIESNQMCWVMQQCVREKVAQIK